MKQHIGLHSHHISHIPSNHCTQIRSHSFSIMYVLLTILASITLFFIYTLYIYLPWCNSSMFTKYNISISSHFTLRKLHRFVVGVHKHEWSLSIHSHLVQEQHLRDANGWGHLGTGADLRRALHHQAVGLLYYVWSLYDLTCPWCNGCCLWDTREVL